VNETTKVFYESRQLQQLGISDAIGRQITVTAPASMPVEDVLLAVRNAPTPWLGLVPSHIDLTGA
jgi:spore germination protein GerM